jgi:hypothetical protein
MVLLATRMKRKTRTYASFIGADAKIVLSGLYPRDDLVKRHPFFICKLRDLESHFILLAVQKCLALTEQTFQFILLFLDFLIEIRHAIAN